MMPEHLAWMSKYEEEHRGALQGLCHSACSKMMREFPELTMVRGYAVFEGGGRSEHVWLTDPQGEVVDPTRGQYHRPFEHVPWKPGDVVEVGTCMCCGVRILKAVQSLSGPREMVCGPECEEELLKEYA